MTEVPDKKEAQDFFFFFLWGRGGVSGEKEKNPIKKSKGRTILMMKDKEKGKAASNYRPITCLEITNRSEEICGFWDTNLLLPQERKGCRRKSRGMNDLLFIDKMILREVKMRKHNLSVA